MKVEKSVAKNILKNARKIQGSILGDMGGYPESPIDAPEDVPEEVVSSRGNSLTQDQKSNSALLGLYKEYRVLEKQYDDVVKAANEPCVAKMQQIDLKWKECYPDEPDGAYKYIGWVGNKFSGVQANIITASVTEQIIGESYQVLREVKRREEYASLDAGVRDKLKKMWYYMSLPIKKGAELFVKNNKKGLDDVFDELIEEAAPNLAKLIMNNRINEALKKFSREKKIPIKKLSKDMRKFIIKEVHDKYEHQITEEAIKTAGKAIVSKMNPKMLAKELKHIFKKHGWKIGLAMACIETWEHFLLPALLTALGFPGIAAAAAVLPQGEVIIYPFLFKYVFKGVELPPVFEEPSPEGSMDWFCSNFPNERMCKEVYACSLPMTDKRIIADCIVTASNKNFIKSVESEVYSKYTDYAEIQDTTDRSKGLHKLLPGNRIFFEEDEEDEEEIDSSFFLKTNTEKVTSGVNFFTEENLRHRADFTVLKKYDPKLLLKWSEALRDKKYWIKYGKEEKYYKQAVRQQNKIEDTLKLNKLTGKQRTAIGLACNTFKTVKDSFERKADEKNLEFVTILFSKLPIKWQKYFSKFQKKIDKMVLRRKAKDEQQRKWKNKESRDRSAIKRKQEKAMNTKEQQKVARLKQHIADLRSQGDDQATMQYIQEAYDEINSIGREALKRESK